MGNLGDQRVAERVRIHLNDAGLSQSAAARQLGISQSSFNRRLIGQVSFRIPELMALAQLLNVTVESLLGQDAA
jgi:transcriptional regulator with XRE-family HTH domain